MSHLVCESSRSRYSGRSRGPEIAIYTVWPQTRHLSARARAFIDFVRARIGPRPDLGGVSGRHRGEVERCGGAARCLDRRGVAANRHRLTGRERLERGGVRKRATVVKLLNLNEI